MDKKEKLNAKKAMKKKKREKLNSAKAAKRRQPREQECNCENCEMADECMKRNLEDAEVIAGEKLIITGETVSWDKFEQMRKKKKFREIGDGHYVEVKDAD